MAGLGGVPPGYLAEDGGDPRLHPIDYPQGVLRKLHDPNITLEEYLHFASLTRAEEISNSHITTNEANEDGFFSRFKKSNKAVAPMAGGVVASEDEKSGEKRGSTSPVSDPRAMISVDEWEQASRAARTASWGAVFCMLGWRKISQGLFC